MILKKIFICAFIFSLIASGASAASRYQGEVVVYDISPFGSAEYRDWGIVELNGQPANLVTFTTHLLGFSDTERIYSEPVTLLPLKIERDINMWGIKEYITENYEPKKFSLVIEKIKDKKVVEKFVYSEKGPIYNAITLPFYLRTIPNLGVGWTMEIRLPNKFKVTLVAIEEIEVPAGKFQACHFTSTPNKFEIWITKDNPRIPIKIKGMDGLGYTLLMKKYRPPSP